MRGWSRELTLPSVSSTLLSLEIILPYNLASLLLYSLTVSFSLLYPIFTSLIGKNGLLVTCISIQDEFLHANKIVQDVDVNAQLMPST